MCEKHTEKPLEDDFQRKYVIDDVLEPTTVKCRESDPNNITPLVKMNITSDAGLLFTFIIFVSTKNVSNSECYGSTHTYTHTHTHKHVHTNTHKHTAHKHTRTQTHMHTHKNTHTNTHTQTHKYTQTHTNTQIRTHTHTYTHTQTHTRTHKY